MDTEYNIIHRILRWFLRFRKRRGYGVHSPYAFGFITDVIYNTDAYYDYAALCRPLPYSLKRLDEYDPVSGLSAKDLRLLFRLANFQEARTVCLCGASPVVAGYIRAARPSAQQVSDPALADFVYYDATTDSIVAPTPVAVLPPRGKLTVLRGIHRNAAARRCWEAVKTSGCCTVSFDLGRFGVAIYMPHLNKEHYVVNYY